MALAIAVVTAVLAAVAIGYFLTPQTEAFSDEDFGFVEKGMSRNEILDLLGRPEADPEGPVLEWEHEGESFAVTFEEDEVTAKGLCGDPRSAVDC